MKNNTQNTNEQDVKVNDEEHGDTNTTDTREE